MSDAFGFTLFLIPLCLFFFMIGTFVGQCSTEETLKQRAADEGAAYYDKEEHQLKFGCKESQEVEQTCQQGE